MKILLLLCLSALLKPCAAQDRPLLSQQLLKQTFSSATFFKPAGTHQNFVISYLRSVNHKTTWDNFLFTQPASDKAPAMNCCQIPKHSLVINKAWLRYHFNAETTDQKVKKASSIAGELMDTFLNQYSIQSKRL